MSYGLSDIDDNGLLKVSALLLVIMLYLSRHLLLVLFVAFNVLISLKRGSAESPFHYLQDYSSGPLFLLASVGSLLVLYSMQKRRPEAGRFVRWVWSRGRQLLIASALLDLLFIVVMHFHHMRNLGLTVLVASLLDLYIIFYLYKSVRVADTFAEFCTPGDMKEFRGNG